MTHARIVIGLGYGDEGKGSWVDHLVRKHNVKHVVRFNGGAQARHHVVTPEGHEHGFSQFSSGTFVPQVKTCLSRFMLVEPLALMNEAEELHEKGVTAPLSRLIISAKAPMIPYHNMLLNRIYELNRGDSRHGSCGYGIGLTQGDVEEFGSEALYMGDITEFSFGKKLTHLFDRAKKKALEALTDASRDLVSELLDFDLDAYAEAIMHIRSKIRVASDEVVQNIIRSHDTVFEGAQGVLLDEQYGTFPHCTRSTTTFQNAETLLTESAFEGEKTRVGLLRAYGTRHGAGPFVTEDEQFFPRCHNDTGEWQGLFRTGWFDAVAARYALHVVGGVDQLAITNLDRLSEIENVKVCTAYTGIDSEFYEQGSIRIPLSDHENLSQLTGALSMSKPVYDNVGRVRTCIDQQRYLEMLEQTLRRSIDAFSCSPRHQKEYRSVDASRVAA